MKNRNKEHRYAVYTKYNFTCNFCGLIFQPPIDWNKKSAIHQHGLFLEIDHIKPLSKGGTDKLENKQALCQNCNRTKRNNWSKENDTTIQYLINILNCSYEEAFEMFLSTEKLISKKLQGI